MKPVVDGLEQRHQERLLVIRVNIQTQAGRELAEVFGFQVTPTFIFFDGEGNEVWRSTGGLDVNRIENWITTNT